MPLTPPSPPREEGKGEGESAFRNPNSEEGGIMGKVRRAIVSVSEKSGVVSFAKGLAQMGVEILSTGGTAKTLREIGISVKDISEYTGFPEMLDGRVKTLHPKVHGGLLGQRSKTEHVQKMKEHGFLPIDLVAVNLIPLKQQWQRRVVALKRQSKTSISVGRRCSGRLRRTTLM